MIDRNGPIVKTLKSVGLPWHLDSSGSHTKIYLCDQMVGVMSTKKNGHHKRAELNVIGQIKKKAKEIRDEKT